MSPAVEGELATPALLRFIGAAYPNRKDRNIVRRALCDPLFPRTFLIRNILALQQEPAWQSCSRRRQRTRLLQILVQRSRFFLQVKDWLQQQGQPLPSAQTEVAAAQPPQPDGNYCNHCGECCEIASGLPQFPVPQQLPQDWQRVFAAGLGPHHRFCAFLWEIAGNGRSVCAIHQWRPVPCRLFEQEECDFLRQHPGPVAASELAPLLRILCRYTGCGNGHNQP